MGRGVLLEFLPVQQQTDQIPYLAPLLPLAVVKAEMVGEVVLLLVAPAVEVRKVLVVEGAIHPQ